MIELDEKKKIQILQFVIFWNAEKKRGIKNYKQYFYKNYNCFWLFIKIVLEGENYLIRSNCRLNWKGKEEQYGIEEAQLMYCF